MPAGAPKPAAARKRVAPRKKPSSWEPNDDSTTREEDEEDEEEGEEEEGEEGSPSRRAGSTAGSGSEASWQAAHPGALGGPDLQPAAWLPAASIARQVSEPLAPGVPAPQPAAGGRRRGAPAADLHPRPGRLSIDLGVMAHAGGALYASASPQLSASVGRAAGRGAQPPPAVAGALKRRTREDDFDPLAVLMDNTSDAAQVSPFSAAAQVLPEGSWTPGSDGGGAWRGAQDPGAEQLAQGLSRLAMRTLSLKRQCSRGGEALDPLEAALLMEVREPLLGVKEHLQRNARRNKMAAWPFKGETDPLVCTAGAHLHARPSRLLCAAQQQAPPPPRLDPPSSAALGSAGAAGERVALLQRAPGAQARQPPGAARHAVGLAAAACGGRHAGQAGGLAGCRAAAPAVRLGVY